MTHKQYFVLADTASEFAVEQVFLDETPGIHSKPSSPKAVKCASATGGSAGGNACCYKDDAKQMQEIAWQSRLRVGMGQMSGRGSSGGE